MYPPHLPPPTCNVSHHRQWQRLKLIGVATFFGLLAGITGAAVTIAFIWPNSDVTTAIVARIPRVAGETVLRERVVRQLNDTTFEIYKKVSTNNGVRYLAPADHLATAAVGVSSGWLVAYLPEGGAVTAAWRVLGPDGTLYTISRSLSDAATGLVYLRIVSPNHDASDTQLKVSQFTNTLATPARVFVSEAGAWVPAGVRTLAPSQTVAPHPDLTTALRLVLDGSYTNGSVVVDEDGVVLGFVANTTTVVPALSAVTMLAGIDTRTTLTYPSVGVEGWFSEEWPLLVGNDQVHGFLVTRVTGKTNLKKGDIITEINGRPMSFATWWALRNDRELTVTVVRQHTQSTITLIR